MENQVINSVKTGTKYFDFCHAEEQIEDIGLFHLRRLVSMIRNVSFLIIIFSMPIMAQPGLPGDPAQAPIDGGLGILAAAGGAYALKKLRDKKKAEEEEME